VIPVPKWAIAYRVKERLRDFYRCRDSHEAEAMLLELRDHCTKKAMPPEIRRLGRTIRDWFAKIVNFHIARVSNGPTEALNNLIKRIKRIGFGFRNFENYRIRALLYAGKPNWRVLGSIVVRQFPPESDGPVILTTPWRWRDSNRREPRRLIRGQRHISHLNWQTDYPAHTTNYRH
jgi:hypothetical protein